MERKRNRERRVSSSFQKFGVCWLCMLVSTCTIIIPSVGIEGKSYRKDSVIYNILHGGDNDDGDHASLTEDSVVVITGAAGFMGSELALALHRTYSPKRIICIDRMGDRPKGKEELARFEYQRQRIFNVMQTLGDKGVFYRADFSPLIPEYHNEGEISVLDHIFKDNLDISHVVHLADPFPHSALQAVPREKEVPKAGMIEALLEQLAKHEREERSKSSDGDGDNTNEYKPPNFVYASSNEVYPYREKADENIADESIAQPLHIVLEESQTLSTPSSLRGVSKMMDEMIAKLYYDTKGIYSVGLRFFSIYGPWGVPGSPLYEMAERAISGSLNGLDDYLSNNDGDGNENPSNDGWKKNKHDFVYIDDAIDAIMAAMQFRPAPPRQEVQSSPHPIIFNVASGEGHSLEDVLKIMHEFFPLEEKEHSTSSSSTVRSEFMGTIGSTKRAKSLLGHNSQVSLREGIIKMLAWHYDRRFPFGRKGNRENKSGGDLKGKNENFDVVTQQGIAGCLPFDKECLRGTPIFPCASECAHKFQCIKSFYDEVIASTEKLTSSCETVLYTVDLNDSLISLPSANSKFQSPKSFLKNTCNVAFVSQHSLLIQNKLKKAPASGHDGEHYQDGSWILIPLKTVPIGAAASDGATDKNGVERNEILRLLPKLSPGLFFRSKATKRAIYIDPNIVIENISKLLSESYLQPYSEKIEGATAMLIGRGITKGYFAADDDDDDDKEEEIILSLQDPNYVHQALDSSNTRVQNSVYSMVKLAVFKNQFGNEFLELLDSRWIVHGLQSDDGRNFRCDILAEIYQWKVTSDTSALKFMIGMHDMWSRVIHPDPWWIGDNVVAVPEGPQSPPVGRRRLQEEEVAVVGAASRNSREEKEVALLAEEKGDGAEEAGDSERGEKMADDDGSEEDSQEETPDDTSGEGEEKDRGEFVADAIAQKEVNAGEEKGGDSSDEVREETRSNDENKKPENDGQESQQHDSSSWMGILSSSTMKSFVRIVPSSEVGIVSIENS